MNCLHRFMPVVVENQHLVLSLFLQASRNCWIYCKTSQSQVAIAAALMFLTVSRQINVPERSRNRLFISDRITLTAANMVYKNGRQ